MAPADVPARSDARRGVHRSHLSHRALVALALLFLALPLAAQTQETVTVTATRTETRVSDTPSSIVVLSAEELASTAAATTDDALRQVPGFTLFRRSGSRVANPTAQGVSLRGIGASGASRALVLDDGIPLNDPFGGWVYWGRVPRVALSRVEVLRGGASDLYGSGAMGGVIQFIRRSDTSVVADVSGGSNATGSASVFIARERGPWHGSLAADLFTTDGYVLVEPSSRGAVDVAADSRHASIDATLGRESAFLRASWYRELRNNGTRLQVNDTTIRQLAAGGELPALGGTVTVRAYGSDQDYRQTFSAIAADRTTERLTIDQRVPSRALGGTVQWTRTLGTRHALIGGADLRHVTGESDELRFAGPSPVRVVSGGRQRTTGVFVEDVFLATPDVSITGGLRYDAWRNTEAWSPRLSVLWHRSDALAFTASAYQAFRAPTLNELYRGFRVGNVLTLANEELGAERLTAFELGTRFRNARLTLFRMTTADTVANVTLSSTPELITRQRRNLGQSRSQGAELEGAWRIRDLLLSAGWLWTDATTGNRRLPQVPRHQATAQLQWRGAGVQSRWSAMQFDDDLNELPLRGYFVTDVFVSHGIGRGVEATLAVENVFDRRVEAGATPVITLGQPRAWRIGLRYGL
ncbi:MAG TPA: TonB-dependent receptor [Thermoanaerobaculia bacterium]|jgi:outer membrane receptor protein involved in Fe transport